MVGLAVLHHAQAALHAVLIAHLDPPVEVFGGEVLGTAELVQEVHNHLPFAGMILAVIGIAPLAVMAVSELLHLLFKQFVRN